VQRSKQAYPDEVGWLAIQTEVDNILLKATATTFVLTNVTTNEILKCWYGHHLVHLCLSPHTATLSNEKPLRHGKRPPLSFSWAIVTYLLQNFKQNNKSWEEMYISGHFSL